MTETHGTQLFEVATASPFCQRWRGGTHSFRHTSEGGFDPTRYSVEALDEATAKDYVVANHYSGTYGAAKFRYGLFEDSTLVGVAMLGIPNGGPKVLTNVFDLQPYTESLELCRFVLDDVCPANSESWFLARCFEEAAARGVRGVVSFADPVPRTVEGRVVFPGHVGTIYQASNAVCVGRSTARYVTLLPDGTILNDNSKQKVRGQKRGHAYVEAKLVSLGAPVMRAGQRPSSWLGEAIKAVGATSLHHRGNHRYAFAIGETRRQRQGVRILPAPGPYPKERDAA